jgi:hypothetical protein
MLRHQQRSSGATTSTNSSLPLSTRHLTEGGGQANHFGMALEPSMTHSRSPAAHSCPPSAPHVSSAVHVSSLATEDLRAKLECRRSGEDGCITIERQWERRHCQGRNLDGDFDAVDTMPVGQATRTPTPSMGSRSGYMALAPHLRMVVWPRKFWPHLPEKYDGSVNPAEFLYIYSTPPLKRTVSPNQDHYEVSLLK